MLPWEMSRRLLVQVLPCKGVLQYQALSCTALLITFDGCAAEARVCRVCCALGAVLTGFCPLLQAPLAVGLNVRRVHCVVGAVLIGVGH